MSEKNAIKLNRLPAITWYWLKMNEASIGDAGFEGPGHPYIENPEDVKLSVVPEDTLKEIATGAGAEFAETANAHAGNAMVFRTEAGQKASGPVRIKLTYENGQNALNITNLVLAANSELTVIQDFTAEEGAKGLSGMLTKADLAEGAVLRLVQIVRVGSGYDLINDLGVRNADNARIELIQLVLDGRHIYQGYQTDLAGYKSSLKNDLAYRVMGDSHLDINDFANHTGKKTECEINVNGVLRDKASKILRATIDLKKGAKGAVGNEKEDVLLMDDGVRNQTIPLILCSEEDVVGNHGATIGRLDESLMFYLASRGLNREQIYEMMAKARIDATVKLIPDQQTQDEINSYLGGGVEDDAE